MHSFKLTKFCFFLRHFGNENISVQVTRKNVVCDIISIRVDVVNYSRSALLFLLVLILLGKKSRLVIC